MHDGPARPAHSEPCRIDSTEGNEMLSRVAENLFWMSRYLERAENVARLLDIGLYLELDAPSSSGDDGSAPVEIALGILRGRNAQRPARPLVGPHRNAVLGFLTFDREQPQLAREHDFACPRKRPRHAGKPGGRRLERDQSALPLPMRAAAPTKVRRAAPRRFTPTVKQSASCLTAWFRTRCRETRSTTSSGWAGISSGSA